MFTGFIYNWAPWIAPLTGTLDLINSGGSIQRCNPPDNQLFGYTLDQITNPALRALLIANAGFELLGVACIDADPRKINVTFDIDNSGSAVNIH